MRALMRGLFLAAIVAILPLDAMQPAEAKEPIPPWCLTAHMGQGWMVDLCYFRTFEQCNQERFGYGTTSFCSVNPEYYFRYGDPTQAPRKRGREAR
jgi:hypothetical protein